MIRVIVAAALACVVAVGGYAQETNSAAGSLDVNGSSGSGSAPFSVTIEHPQPVVIQVSGTANQPYVLLGANGLDVGNTVFTGVGQIDIGPTPGVLVDGISGPFFPHFANTGSSGTGVIQVPVPMGSVATGVVVRGLQAAVVDPTIGPFGVRLTAATTLSFTNNVSLNAQPVADAGVSSFTDTGVCVTLDGSGSMDPEGSGLIYTWTQTVGTTVSLMNASTATPSFIAPSTPETLVFELVVNDGNSSSAASTVYVPVQAGSPTVSFANDVVPVLSACTSCHVSGHSSGLDMATSPATAYAGLQTRILICDPPNSLALQKPLGNLGHGGGTVFSSTMVAGYQTMLTWITEGAPNN